MRNIKLTIEYDGTDFQGWQLQRQNLRTVQGEIEKVLQIIFKKHIRVFGSGRTDSGVHALGQVAHFKIDSKIPTEEIVPALNGNLPKDIAVLNAEEVDDQFHAQFSARRKAYRYTILYRSSRSALRRDFCLHIPYRLNVALMRREAKTLVGRKDFRSFMASDPHLKMDPADKNTIRTVYAFSIRRQGDCLHLDIEANGFLYKMVRNIVGTLLAIGSGKLPPGSMTDILRKKSRLAAGMTAPAKGLRLVRVRY